MLFNSFHFLLFFPIVVLIYFLIPHKYRWIWLLISSYYFYMSWNPEYAILIAISTVITYLSGLLIDASNRIKAKKKRHFQRRLWVILSLVSNLSILFFYKYFDFALDNVNRGLQVLGMQPWKPTFDVLLPVGISFYTFQALSYTMDVYRGDIYAEKNLAKYALFVSFFPQLVAGPIERSKNLLLQINERHDFNYERVKSGLLLMLWGFFQKIVIADRIAILVNHVFNNYQSYAGFEIVVAVLFFSVQIYCDFSGYSDIAIGAAQVMGFRLMENFQQPYLATSIRDFWRRWHISLSTWFRDYLYIPLGGNRCTKMRKYANLMITFLASGLWHGASWNYVLWGGIHGGYQIVGEVLKPYKEKTFKKLNIQTQTIAFRAGQIILTFLLVNVAWIFFRSPSAGTAFDIIKRIGSNFNPWVFFDGSLYELGLNPKDLQVAVLAIALLAAVNLWQYRNPTLQLRAVIAEQNLLFRWMFYYAAIFVVLILGVYGPGYDASQFIYFQF